MTKEVTRQVKALVEEFSLHEVLQAVVEVANMKAAEIAEEAGSDEEPDAVTCANVKYIAPERSIKQLKRSGI